MRYSTNWLRHGCRRISVQEQHQQQPSSFTYRVAVNGSTGTTSCCTGIRRRRMDICYLTQSQSSSSLSKLRAFSTVATPESTLHIAPTTTTASTPPELPEMDMVDSLLEQSGISRDYIEALGKQHPTPLRLKDMYEYGSRNDDPLQRIRNAQFLHREFPVRIAHRAIDLLTLPHGLSNALPIQQVATIYLTFLRRLHDFPLPTNVELEERFTDTLQTMILDRTSIPTSIAQGIQAWWQKMEDGSSQNNHKMTAAEQYQYEDRLREMDQALVRFFTARVGLRFLAEQFVLSSPRESAQAFRNHSGMLPLLTTTPTSSEERPILGAIQPRVDVAQEVRRMADLVAQQTKEYYNGLCPEIHIVDCSSDYDEFTFVPHHLQYMVCELLKNSCRASVRKYKEREAAAVFGDTSTSTAALSLSNTTSKITIPAIRVIIVKGSEDVTIKVADQGGGIPRSRMATIWRFAHSTANMDEQATTFGVDPSSGARLRGFGLPLAEIYARYFGGELTLKSTEGYGLDAYLHLPRLGDACENLPLRVRDSPAGGVSLPTTNGANRTSFLASRPRTMGTRSVRSGGTTTSSYNTQTMQSNQQQKIQQNNKTVAQVGTNMSDAPKLGALDLATSRAKNLDPAAVES